MFMTINPLLSVHTAGWRIVCPFSTACTCDTQTARAHHGILNSTGVVNNITKRVHSLWIHQIGIDT